MRPLIERSWERCRVAGIDPALTQAAAPLLDDELTALRARYRDLLEASAPVMAQAREILSASGTIMILTDPHGVILQTEGDPATVDAARLIRLQTGANWHELACGTRGLMDRAAAKDCLMAFKRLSRVSEIQHLLIRSWDVLTTLTPDEFFLFQPAALDTHLVDQVKRGSTPAERLDPQNHPGGKDSPWCRLDSSCAGKQWQPPTANFSCVYCISRG